MKFDFMRENVHKSVLLKEAISYLKVTPGEKYIDATVGGGGHSWEILKRGGVLLGLDVDPDALGFFKRKLEDRGWKLDNEVRALRLDNLASSVKLLTPPSSFQHLASRVILVQINFKHIDKVVENLNFGPVSGILFDLGLSSYQLEKSDRGFSFKRDEPLDMRMDPTLTITASDLVNNLCEEELHALFSKLGEEHFAGRIAAAICKERRVARIEDCKKLAEIIKETVPRRGRIHPATKVFQALRIAVNKELESLGMALPKAVKLLKSGGKLVIISFHSLEDRPAKRLSSNKDLEVLTRKVIRPDYLALKTNPKARSAKMRVFEKL